MTIHPMRSTFLFVLLVILPLILAACSFSLTADVPPPPGYIPPTLAVPQAQPLSPADMPVVPPDPAAGQKIYFEECAPCHGQSGLGDGTRAADLSEQPPALGNTGLSRAAVPVEWFRVVTAGRPGKLMPAFSGLSDRQRWDVVAYSLLLAHTPVQIEAGRSIYDANCSVCHGFDGRGVSGAPDWSIPARLSVLAGEQLEEVVKQGVKDKMPAFGALLSESERQAVSAYVRTLGFKSGLSVKNNAASIEAGPASTAGENVIENDLLTIRGSVAYASGKALPAGLEVILQAFESMNPVLELKTPVNADGSYRFDEVTYVPERLYVALVELDGLLFNSSVVKGADIAPGETVDMPLTLYEVTEDTGHLSAQRLHIFFDFSSAETLQVAELYLIGNSGERVVVAPAEGQPVLTYKLPEGAGNLQFQDGEMGGRFIQTSDGFGDTASILPGSQSHQVLFAFEVPYLKQITLELTVPLPVEAVMVAVPAEGVRLESSQLELSGERVVEGTTISTYTANGLSAGTEVVLKLSGRPGMQTAVVPGSEQDLLIGAGALGLVVVGICAFFIIRRREKDSAASEEAASGESQEEVLDAILALDDRYAAGEISEGVYAGRRAELKEQLRVLTKQSEESPLQSDLTGE